MARPRRPRKQRAPRAPSAAPPPSYSFADYAGAAGAGWGAANIGALGGQAAYAMGAGGGFRWQHSIGELGGGLGTAIGAAVGSIFPGVGTMVGMGIGGSAGGFLGGMAERFFTARLDASLGNNLAAAMTGFNATGLKNALGFPLPQNGFASGFGGLSGLPGMNEALAYQGISLMAPYLATNGRYGDLAQTVGRYMQAYGRPDEPAFQAAASALGPALFNPLLAQGFAGGSPGVGGASGAYLALGPGAAFAAINASGDPTAQNAFRSIHSGAVMTGLQSAAMATQAQAGGAAVLGMMAGGGRSGVLSALAMQEEALGQWAGAVDAQAGVFRPGMEAGDPYSTAQFYGLQSQRAGILANQRVSRFQRATIGPSEGFINSVSSLATEAQIAMMDPATGGFVPSRVRRGLISQYNTRLSEIDEQSANNPAAAAALAGERSGLMVSRAGELNALRYGSLGQMLNVFGGAPSGFQAMGLGAASSLAALQLHDRGVAQAFGGSGASVGNATSEETNNLLRQILMALNGNRNPGGSGGSYGSPYSLVNDRVNGKIGG